MSHTREIYFSLKRQSYEKDTVQNLINVRKKFFNRPHVKSVDNLSVNNDIKIKRSFDIPRNLFLIAFYSHIYNIQTKNNCKFCIFLQKNKIYRYMIHSNFFE